MQALPHPHVTAAFLAAGSLIAAAPAVVASAPQTGTRLITLTADSSNLLQQVLDGELNTVNSTITGTGGLLDSNAGLVTGEGQLIQSMLATGGIAPGADQDFGTQYFDHLFDAGNSVLGAGQGALLGLLGARAGFDPEALNASLLSSTDSGYNYFGGLEQVFGQFAAWAGQNSLLPGGAGDATALGNLFGTLVDGLSTFNTDLISAEEAFNTNLVNSELAMEQAVFGSDNALNGAVDRAFNAFNMLYDAQEQSTNNLIGVGDYTPQDLTQTLLTGTSGDQIFNDGSVGGLTGAFNQILAMFTDLAGLQPSDWTGVFTNVDSAAFATAFNDFLTTVGSSPFGDVFSTGLSPVFTDFTNIFDALSGASG